MSLLAMLKINRFRQSMLFVTACLGASIPYSAATAACDIEGGHFLANPDLRSSPTDALFRVFVHDGRTNFILRPSLLDTALLLRWNGQVQTVKWVRTADSVALIGIMLDSTVGNDADPQGGRIDMISALPIVKDEADLLVIDATDFFNELPSQLGQPGSRVEHWPGDCVNASDDAVSLIGMSVFQRSVNLKVAQARSEQNTSVHRLFSSVLSFIALPESPMKGRTYDPRVGYFSDDVQLGFSPNPLSYPANIRRFRLEHSPAHGGGKAKAPIVFNIDPSMPEKWRGWIASGIEGWQRSFQAAGYAHAIVARTAAPSLDDDLRDPLASYVRWRDIRSLRSPREADQFGAGAISAPNLIVDPRSGEILSAQIVVSGDPQVGIEHLRDRYFARFGALDERAWSNPLPSAVMGPLMRAYMSHEIGHALGLVDGHYGEFAYTVENIRDPKWLTRMSFTPSIMNYSRENGIVQPEDHIAFDLLMQKVGVADDYLIRWGYEDFAPQTERASLSELAQVMRATPWLRYVREKQVKVGPAESDEVVEAADPVLAAELGIRNVERTIYMMPEGIDRQSWDPELARHNFIVLINYWEDLIKYVALCVGGLTPDYPDPGAYGEKKKPVSANLQRKALHFFVQRVFGASFLLRDDKISSIFNLYGIRTTVEDVQINFMKRLFDSARLNRIVEASTVFHQPDAVTLPELNRSVWDAVFSDTMTHKVNLVDRQVIIRAYIEALSGVRSSKSGLSTSARVEVEKEIYATKKRLEDMQMRVSSASDRSFIGSLYSELENR